VVKSLRQLFEDTAAVLRWLCHRSIPCFSANHLAPFTRLSPSETIRAKRKAYIKLLGNPYASLSLDDEAVDPQPPSLDARRAYLRTMGNPYAFAALCNDEDEQTAKREEKPPATHRSSSGNTLPTVLDDLLQLYKPYVARDEWARVLSYREEFLAQAPQSRYPIERLTQRIGDLIFSLMPGEKVQFNRAPADRIITELKRLLV
jgi:hypothetical protein